MRKKRSASLAAGIALTSAMVGEVHSGSAQNSSFHDTSQPTSAASDVAQISSKAVRPRIVWRKRMSNGVDLGVVSEPDTLDGKPIQNLSPYSVSPKDFLNDDVYYGALPDDVRADMDFVHFVLRGTARENPEDGTVVSIDGAVVGFVVQHDQQPGSEYTQLAAQIKDPDGTFRWQSLDILIPSAPHQLVALPKLAIRFNRQRNTWALYLKSIVIQENLPLLTEGRAPVVTVRAGRVGDTARLMDLVIAKEPPSRSAQGPRAEKEKIDLRTELEAGNQRIKVFYQPH